MGGFLSKRAAATPAGVEGELAHVFGTAGGEDLIGSFWDASDSSRPNVILVTVKHVEVYHPDSGECFGRRRVGDALGGAALIPRPGAAGHTGASTKRAAFQRPRSSSFPPARHHPPCARCFPITNCRRPAHARGASRRGLQRGSRADLLLRRRARCRPQARHDRCLRCRDAQVRPFCGSFAKVVVL